MPAHLPLSRVPVLRVSLVLRLVTLVTVAASAACGGAPDAGGPGGPPGGGGFAVPVELKTLAATPVEQSTEFVGTLKSRRSTTIQPQVEGFLTRILVKSGDRVSRGTPLFDVDSSTQQSTVATLRSQRAAREADAVFARQQAQRAKALLDVGAMSQQEFEQAVAQQTAAEAQLKAIDDQIRQQETELAYYRVVSPTAGVIGDVPVRVGDRVTRSTELTTVDDNAGLEVYINVPVQQAPQLRVGLAVRILDESGGTIATERVNFVAGSVDEQTQSVLAKTPLTQRNGQFRSDQFVRTRIVWSESPAITIPLVAVMRVSGQHFVYVAEAADSGLVAKQRAVMLGPVIGSDYVVLSGLSAGDKLIVSGIQKIGDGAPVQDAAAMKPPQGAAPAAGGGRGGRP
jgi:RND family efflux transporter MFP subunit